MCKIYWIVLSSQDEECWLYTSETGNIHFDDDDPFFDDDDPDEILYFNQVMGTMFTPTNFLGWSSYVGLGKDYKTVSTRRKPS